MNSFQLSGTSCASLATITSTQDFRFEFKDDDGGLVSVMSWCIACGWEFDFLARAPHFAIRTDNDEQIAICWPEGVQLKPTTPVLLGNLEFSPSESW
jgi:hypothetical protein